ncbi:MAG: hypothetical protein DHS20C09_01140 [marine bacterium B5-7]|nr:MAG: hypothetical protein DHS20C09_01140 [marine bacterium B5-7]
MRHIAITINETAHWHALIGKAEYLTHQLLPLGIEDYLVRLFLRSEKEDIQDLGKKSDIAQIASSEEKLRRLGDQCLLLCGFYPQASQEYGVALDEFISMGSDAYKKLSSLVSGEDEMICEYLAVNFSQVSELICFIAEFSDKSNNKYRYKTAEQSEDAIASFKRAVPPQFSSPISHRVLN